MTEIGEGVEVGAPAPAPEKVLIVGLLEIWFDSGIELHDLDKDGLESRLPPRGKPHWGTTESYPAAYVRQGGAGETKKLRVRVRWEQKGCDGEAKLSACGAGGALTVAGTFPLEGEAGERLVLCEFTKKPAVVRNGEAGFRLRWTLQVSGQDVAITDTEHELHFLDAAPKPISWGYPKHYRRAVAWATRWADGRQGEAAVYAAIWSHFKGPKLVHATGFSYWKTKKCAQNLKDVLHPGFADEKGWSCAGIAHLFMECLAVHGIVCCEVIVEVPDGVKMFLVKNWEFAPAPARLHRHNEPQLYNAGVWISLMTPPLNRIVRLPGGDIGPIDCRKLPGVPAQGQLEPPVMFGNHWIVRTQGSLHDTSYGGVHADAVATYTEASIDGWLASVRITLSGMQWFTKRYADVPLPLRIRDKNHN